MTQEFPARRLTVHRPGVNITARLFQQAGLPVWSETGCTCVLVTNINDTLRRSARREPWHERGWQVRKRFPT
jgi:hypothetical protein